MCSPIPPSHLNRYNLTGGTADGDAMGPRSALPSSCFHRRQVGIMIDLGLAERMRVVGYRPHRVRVYVPPLLCGT